MNQTWREETLRIIQEHSSALAASPLYGEGHSELRIERGYPPLINNNETTLFARQAAENLIGRANVEDFEPKMWGEDFAYYTEEIPGTFWMLGVRPPHLATTPGLHNSKFILDENALPIGAALLANAALSYFAA
jgi:metal-dependent amidase/aminoacylase/carboxypeptidase family protein